MKPLNYPWNLLTFDFVQTRYLDEATEYRIFDISARELIIPRRIDLTAKLIYIDCYVRRQNLEFGLEIYEKHLEAFSDGTFIEPGSPEKNTFQKYVNTFNELIESFRISSFDNLISLIPVGADMELLDGAHRCACAAYFDQEVTVIQIPSLHATFDYKYFMDKHLSDEIISYMTLKYCDLTNRNTFAACLWPSASGLKKRQQAIEKIASNNEVIYIKDIKLKYQGLRNFMLQIYSHQDWIGTQENHYFDLTKKVNACYKQNQFMTIVIFESKNSSYPIQLKDEIRNIFGIGKHSIHISDTRQETQQICELLLNHNSIHHLNFSEPDRFTDTIHLLCGFSVPCGSLMAPECTLAVYGLKECDYFNVAEVENISVSTANPRNYFLFVNHKFFSLNYLYDKKKEGHPLLSPIEESLVEKFLTDTGGDDIKAKRDRKYLVVQKQWKRKHLLLKIRQKLVQLTKIIGIYKMLHLFYYGDTK